jgi:hypothetical protein
MKVKIRIRLTPFRPLVSLGLVRKTTNAPRLERIAAFPLPAHGRKAASPFSVWAVSLLMTICFLSMTMFATLGVPPQSLLIDDEDPSRPVVGELTDDCRVLIRQHRAGPFACAQSTIFSADTSGTVIVGRNSGTLASRDYSPRVDRLER